MTSLLQTMGKNSTLDMMAKKFSKKKGFWHFLWQYFFLVFVAFLAFGATNLLLAKQPAVPTCANTASCTSDLQIHIDNNMFGFFEGKKVMAPRVDGQQLAQAQVLGASTGNGPKHIFVDLAAQTLYAYQGSTLFMKTLISSGKWDRTPTGNFYIWEKLISTRMAGGSGADAYDLPNVPYVMYFYNDFGLHGAYWHDNFGHVMSHGCVNMRIVDAKHLFAWAEGPDGNTKGTEVSICDKIVNGTECVQDNPIQKL